MRFVNTTTYKFREVVDQEIHTLKGGYSILSHRWALGDDEITYANVLSLSSSNNVKANGGFGKFAGGCRLAKTLGSN
ncbi:hypothetical protein SAMD00023353_11500090 [Rosellinia necatrix]|uniref:Uncharacterized protein n=1 Tax=Rosellinia necatrix TaxID=77044 RepID=A0A1S8ABP4_ROSNE|nr:hypothetical protein SAMD00023353_11500090 [Rosellinia necatrix]